MSTLMTAVAAVVSAVATMVSDWIEVIMTSGNEILLLFVLLPLVGIGVGMLKRLMTLN